MEQYLNAIKQECDHYKSQEHKKSIKIMIDVKNELDKVRNSYIQPPILTK